MFNTNTTNVAPRITNNIEIQACSGGIYKSHPKSKIVRMHINSPWADRIFCPGRTPIVDEKPIVILQIVNAVEGYVLVEYMTKEDYEAENVVLNKSE